MTTKADKVRAAADHIQNFGWTQGQFGAALGEPCCAAGALWATTDYDEGITLTREFAKHLGLIWSGDVFVWNDKAERTAEEVIAALRGWADSLERDAQSV